MNKAEMAQMLAEKLNVSKKETEDMLNAFTDIVTATLKKDEEVVLLKPLEVTNTSAKATFATAQKLTIPKALAAIYAQGSPLIVVIRVSGDEPSVSNISGTEESSTGVFGFLKAQSVVGFTPKIIIAPKFSHDVSVQEALKLVTQKLRAVAIIDMAETSTRQDALAFSEKHSTSRFYPIHGCAEGVGDIGTMPLSPFVAGLIAVNDLENGYWSSPSNKILNGIKRITNPLTWSLSDPNCEANLVNEKGIATVIRQGGFRLWGNRTLGKNSAIEQAHVFLNVRRITDAINDSIMQSVMWAMDKNITKNFIQDVLESVNNFIRSLRNDGAIINGNAFVVLEENPPDQIKQGKVVFSFDYTPVFPAESIKFKSIITDQYLAEVLA